MKPLAAGIVFGYLAVALVVGVLAGRKGKGGTDDFVAGERAFGPVVMYFVVGATIFSAYALLGTPQRVIAKGSDAFYVLAFGAVGLVPLFFYGARVRRIGAREGFVTQAELFAARFESPSVSVLMGSATLLAFVPYLVIQLKGAGVVMHAVTGWPEQLGAGLVYAVVLVYVLAGGVRGVGWTNVIQGVVMLIAVWVIGLWLPTKLYGSVGAMFDRVVAEHPEYLTLPGPEGKTPIARYSSEIIMSILGFAMWPHMFMKCFTARSARLVQLSVVFYPTFLFFILPLLFLGYVALLAGGPTDDSVLLWLVDLVSGEAAHPVLFAFLAFAILAASMSTGDALLHAGGSIMVRDVLLPLESRPRVRGLLARLRGGQHQSLRDLDHAQTRAMRVVVVVLALVSWLMLGSAGGTSVVDLLLLAYAVPLQFLPVVMLGLYWRRANGVGARAGLIAGLGTIFTLFVIQKVAPGVAAMINPLELEIGLIGLVVNVVAMVGFSLTGPRPSAALLERFEL
ncbi:sodium:solute symporter family protein [Enhygromyxa salina]|uniref:Putative symporter YodF n=1 Tax=Enhygromyxa salina TaxID=215803 RepID=A0A2S9YTL9_9BACT|nr:sodium:solute symporter family protein [Enhygromyxa salina]PRQ08436.1 putative symporter YodF [Enhygromyxa salina]